MLYLCPHKAHTDYRNFIIKPMNIQELLNRTDRFAANAGCKITEVDTEHAVGLGHRRSDERPRTTYCWHQQQYYVCLECQRG